MKTLNSIALVVVLLSLLSVCDAIADKPVFEIEAVSSYGTGDIAYEISASSLRNTVRSRLEFPLDGLYLGANANYNIGAQFCGVQNLTFGFKFLTNVTDPDEDMNDFDWWNGKLVGDTESEAEASSYILDFSLQGDLVYRPDFVFSGIVGFRYESYEFDIYGVNGYYLPPIGDGSDVFLSLDNHVLAYEMTHSWFYGGIEGRVIITDSLVAEGSGVIGVGFVDDQDDHILREKISTSEYISISSKLTGYLIWYLVPPDASMRFYLKAGGEIYTMYGEGEQDQHFEDGRDSFSGIDSEIEMTFISVNAMFGCSL